MKDFGDVEVEGFKRTGGKKKFRKRKLIRIEEDGSKTTAHTLEINGENKLHNWEGPALTNEEQKIESGRFFSNIEKSFLISFKLCISFF